MEMFYTPTALVLTLVVFAVILAGAMWDLRQTNRAIRERHRSRLVRAANRQVAAEAAAMREHVSRTVSGRRPRIPPF